MPYELTWEDNGVYKRFYGIVTGDEYIESIHKTHGNSKFDYLKYSILDYSDVEGHTISTTDFKRIAAYFKGAYEVNNRIVVAVIVTRKDLLEVVNRFDSLPFASYPFIIVTTLEEARDWIRSSLENQSNDLYN